MCTILIIQYFNTLLIHLVTSSEDRRPMNFNQYVQFNATRIIKHTDEQVMNRNQLIDVRMNVSTSELLPC